MYAALILSIAVCVDRPDFAVDRAASSRQAARIAQHPSVQGPGNSQESLGTEIALIILRRPLGPACSCHCDRGNNSAVFHSVPTTPDDATASGARDDLVRTIERLVQHVAESPAKMAAGTAAPEAAHAAMRAAQRAEQRIRRLSDRLARMEHLAHHDPLTELLNRRSFDATFARAVDLAGRRGEPGVLVCIDLDGFKEINDIHGHAAGDKVLRAVARLLADNVRSCDTVGRLGGDEFAVVLARTSERDGVRRARALEALIDTTQVPWRGATLVVRASFGIVPFGPETLPEVIFDRADGAMYRRKRGRNRSLACGGLASPALPA